MDLTLIVGLAAATLTTAAFAPRAVRTWRTRPTRDNSLGMVSVPCTGVALWLLYGLLTGDPPVIPANRSPCSRPGRF